MSRAGCALSLWVAVLGAGCEDDAVFTVPTEVPDLGCQVSTSRTFQVFFVVDVSNSVAANDVLDAFQAELLDFAFAFPEFDSNENRVLVDYYVIGFVNDFRFFPPGSERMTAPVAVSEALEQAQVFGSMQDNTDVEENLLDALNAVFEVAFDEGSDGELIPNADRILVIGTTDDNFVDQGDTLTPGIQVQTSYADLSQRMSEQSDVMSVFMFTPGDIEGIDRNFRLQPPLPVERFNLNALTGSSGSVGRILTQVAVDAACTQNGTAP
ncbi:MAG: hypothetical protein AAF627_18905 [Myxococcota bacterium]